jgi:hypothetical protein
MLLPCDLVSATHALPPYAYANTVVAQRPTHNSGMYQPPIFSRHQALPCISQPGRLATENHTHSGSVNVLVRSALKRKEAYQDPIRERINSNTSQASGTAPAHGKGQSIDYQSVSYLFFSVSRFPQS